jgi:hypothetical protein
MQVLRSLPDRADLEVNYVEIFEYFTRLREVGSLLEQMALYEYSRAIF